MLKKSILILSISAAYFVQAQDVSVIRNSIDAYSNSNFQGSAKFNAMGGSNGALGGDASSLLTNPAGLGVAISGELSGTLSVSNYENTSTFGGSSNRYRNTRGDLGNVGGVLTFQLMTESAWKFINLGVNFSSQSLDNYIETPGNTNVGFDFPGNTRSTLARHAYDRYGSLTKSSFGVGANYNNALYLGAGLNFFNASFDQSDTAALTSQAGNTDFYSKQGTPFSEASSGFSASFGVIGKLNRNFRLGASIETPTFWQIDRSYSFYNDPNFGDDIATESRRFNSPLKATASAAYVANKNFSINLDYSIGITKPRYKVFGDAERELNDFFSDNSRSMQEVKVGAEYRMKQFRLRGGYGYASNPMDALTVSAFNNSGGVGERSYSNLILSDRNTISFGLGYDFKSFYIDASYQNMTSKFANPFLFGFIDGAQGIDSAYYSPTSFVESDSYAVSDVKNIRNNFFLTLGWKF